MPDNQWVCQKCGKKGGFTLMGYGFIACEGCGAWYLVKFSGELLYIPGDTPNLVKLKVIADRLAE